MMHATSLANPWDDGYLNDGFPYMPISGQMVHVPNMNPVYGTGSFNGYVSPLTPPTSDIIG
jgi:hypothetical protein